MFKVIIKDTYDEVSKEAFKVMKAVLDEKKDAVLGLATGSTPIGLYQEMIKDHKENGTSYKDVITFNLDEYVGIPQDHRESYYTFMHKELFDHIDCPEDHIHVPFGAGEDPEADAAAYEDEIKKYGIHAVFCEIPGTLPSNNANPSSYSLGSFCYSYDSQRKYLDPKAFNYVGDIESQKYRKIH